MPSCTTPYKTISIEYGMLHAKHNYISLTLNFKEVHHDTQNKPCQETQA